MACETPCATCLSSDPTSCISCLQGYSISGTICASNTDCSRTENCLVCPLGFAFSVSNTNTKLNQTCVSCNSGSNCARCSVSNTSQCLSCTKGTYLNGSVCSNCAEGCSSCISLQQCTACSSGFLPAQSGSIFGTSPGGLLNCIACTSPCSTCRGDPTYCTSCINSHVLISSACIKDFNFGIQITFDTTLVVFEANYLTFLNLIASTAGVTFRDLAVTSIASGSVTVSLAVSSANAQGSNAAVDTQNNINNLLSQSTVAGMPVNSFALSASQDNSGEGGLTSTTKIILATTIPLGFVRNIDPI